MNGLNWDNLNQSANTMADLYRDTEISKAKQTLDKYGVDPNLLPTQGDIQENLRNTIVEYTPNSLADYDYDQLVNRPNSRRERKLEEATARNRQILEGRQREEDTYAQQLQYNSGLPQEIIDEVLANRRLLNTMSGEERLDNYLRYSQNDPNALEDVVFAQDLAMKSADELRGLYGNQVAEYAYQNNNKSLSRLQQATGIRAGERPDEIFSKESALDAGLSMLSKAGKTAQSILDSAPLMVAGKQAVPYLAQEEGIFDKFSEWVEKGKSETRKGADRRQETNESMYDAQQIELQRLNRAKGQTEEEADSSAYWQRQYNQLKNAFEETRVVTDQVAEFIPDLVGAAGVAKGAYSVANKATKAVNKAVNTTKNTAKATEYATKVGEKAGQQARVATKVKTGIDGAGKYQVAKETGKAIESSKIEAKMFQVERAGNIANHKATKLVKDRRFDRLQKLTNKQTNRIAHKVGKLSAWGAVVAHSSNQEANDAIATTYNMINDMDNKEFLKTPVGNKLLEELANKHNIADINTALENDELAAEFLERKSDIASEAAINAYQSVFRDSALINTLTSGLELKLAGVGKADGSTTLGQYVGNVAKGQLQEMSEEFVQGYSGERNPKIATNEALQVNLYDPDKQSVAVGLQGAIIASISSGGFNALPLGAKGVAKAVEKPVSVVNKKGKESQDIKENNDLAMSVTGMKFEPEGKSTINKAKSALGITPNISKENQEQLNKAFAESDTYKSINKARQNLIDAISKDNSKESQAQVEKLKSATEMGIVKTLVDSHKLLKNRQEQLANKPNLTKEEQTELDTITQDLNTIEQHGTEIRESFTNDYNKTVDSNQKYVAESGKLNDEIAAISDELTSLQNDSKELQAISNRTEEQDVQLQQNNAKLEELKNRNIKLLEKHKELTKLIDELVKAENDLSNQPLFNLIGEIDPYIEKDIDTGSIGDISGSSLKDLNISSNKVINDFKKQIEKINNNESFNPQQKAIQKRKLARNMIKQVKDIASSQTITTSNVKNKWKELNKTIDDIIDSLNSDKDGYGLQANEKNTVVNSLQQIRAIGSAVESGKLDNRNISEPEMLTLYGKYVGTANGGYGNKGNRGLLNYIQSALGNKGRLNQRDVKKLEHFRATQEAKLNNARLLLNKALIEQDFDKDGKFTKPLVLENDTLKTSGTVKRQGTDEDVTFDTLGKLQGYIHVIESDQNMFDNMVGKMFGVKLSGSKATKETNPTPKKSTKKANEPKAKKEPKQEPKEQVKEESKPTEQPVEEPVSKSIKDEPKQEQKQEQEVETTEPEQTTQVKEPVFNVPKSKGLNNIDTNQLAKELENLDNLDIDFLPELDEGSAKVGTTKIIDINSKDILLINHHNPFVFENKEYNSILEAYYANKDRDNIMQRLILVKMAYNPDYYTEITKTPNSNITFKYGNKQITYTDELTNLRNLLNKNGGISYSDFLKIAKRHNVKLNFEFTPMTGDKPLSSLIDDKWDSTTGSVIVDRFYSDKDNLAYRLRGLDLFKSEKDDKPQITNVLNKDGISIKEEKPLIISAQTTDEQIDSKYSDNLDDKLFADSFRDLLVHVEEELSSGLRLAFTRDKGLDKSAIINGFLNLVGISYDDLGGMHIEYPQQIVNAFSNAIIDAITDSRQVVQTGSSVVEQYNQMGVYNLLLEDVTGSPSNTLDKSKSNLLEFVRHSAFNKSNLSPTQLSNYLKTVKTEEDTDYFSTLGMEKSQFTKQLGDSVMKHLGIKVKPNSPNVLDYEALSFSLGSTLLSLMHRLNMLRHKRIIKYKGSDILQGLTNATKDNITTVEQQLKDNIAVIDHINFKWESASNYSSRDDVKKFYFNAQKIREAFKDNLGFEESIEYFTNPKNQITANTIKNLGFSNLDFLKALTGTVAYSDTELGKQILGDKPVKSLNVFTEPVKATARDIQHKTNSGNNTTALEIVNEHNKIHYKINKGLYDFVFSDTKNQEALQNFLGNNKTSDLEVYNKSLQSKGDGINREMSLIQQTHGSLTNPDTDHFYLKHKMIASQRVMIDGVSPQSLKLVREFIIPDNVDKDGNSVNYGFELDTDVTNHDLNYLNLLEEALQMVKDSPNYLRFNRNIDLTQDRYANLTGYALALAQALDIKIENLQEADAISQLINKLNDRPLRAMVNDIAQAIRHNQPLPQHFSSFTAEDGVTTTAEDLGINSSVAFHALFTLAQLKEGQGLVDGKFQSKLTIEMDGKGNGVYNNVKQFSTGFTHQFFQNLKKTGIATADAIAYQLKGNSNLSDKEAKRLLQSTRFLFSKDDSNDTLRDVYESVADEVSKDIKRAIDSSATLFNFDKSKSLYENLFETKSINDPELTVYEYELQEAESLSQSQNYTQRQLGRHIRDTLNLLITTAMLNEIDGFKNDNIDFFGAIRDVNSLEIGRSVAKLAVTPANYGGQLDGISSQVHNDFKKALVKRVHKFAQLIRTNSTNLSSDKIQQEKTRILQLLKVLDIKYDADNIKLDTVENAITSLNQLATIINLARNTIYEELKSSIGNVLNKAIDSIYGDQFTVVRSIIQLDNALFNMFISEYQDSIKNFMRTRNRDNNWTEVNDKGEEVILNPRAYEYPSKAEIKNILANLRHLPNIATAMSNNTTLINELYNSGNSLSQEIARAERKETSMSTVYGLLGINDDNSSIGSVLKRALDSYKPAGASLLISSIVSTEALTQGRLIKSANKKGIGALNVFDGTYINPIYREVIGSEINRITDQVHEQTSLLTSFYDYFARSNVQEQIHESVNTQQGRANLMETLKALNKSDNLDIPLSVDTLIAAQVSVNSAIFTLTHSHDPDNYKLLSLISKAESKSRELINRIIGELTLDQSLLKNTNKVVSLANADELKQLKNFIGAYRVIANQGFHIEALKQLRDMAVESRIMSDIERDFLPAVIGQFGGVNDGYIRTGRFVKQTFEDFIKFLNQSEEYNGVTNLNPRSSSDALVEFIYGYEPIVSQMTKLRKQYRQEMALPIYTKNEDKQLQVYENDTTTLGTLLDDIQSNTKKMNDELNGTDIQLNSIVANYLAPALKDIQKITNKLLDRDEDYQLPVYTSKQAYKQAAEKAFKFGSISQEVKDSIDLITDTNNNVLGNYQPTVGILVSDNNFYTGLHEAVHSATRAITYNHYMGTLNNPRLIASMNMLEAVARDIAGKFLNNSAYLKIQDIIQKEGSFHVDNAYKYTTDTVVAMAVNFNNVFNNPDFLKDKSSEEIAKQKTMVMQEFLAYSLTNADAMNYLRYNGLKNRSDVLKQTGFGKVWAELTNTLDRALTAFLGLFGLRTNKDSGGNIVTKNRFDKSYLGDIARTLEVMRVSTKKVEKLNDLDNISNSVNTTTFNNKEFATTEQAIKSLGSMNNIPNSEQHKQLMVDLYNTVNSSLELPEIKGYSQAVELLKDNTYNREAIDSLVQLRNKGLHFTSLEENMFKLMYATNKANIDNNSNYQKEVLRTLNKLHKDVPTTFRGGELYETIFAMNPSAQLALFQTNESIKNSIESYLNDDTNKLQNFGKTRTLYKSLPKKYKDSSDLTKLSYIAAKLEFDSNQSILLQAKQLREQKRTQELELKAITFVNDISKHLPTKSIPTSLRLIANELFSGNIYESDTHLEKGLQAIANRSAQLANRPTAVSQLIKLMLGAMHDTQYIYDMQNRSTIVAEATREKVGKVVNAVIQKEFGRQLNEKEQSALANGYFGSNLHHLLEGINEISISEILTDKQYRDSVYDSVKNQLLGLYENHYDTNKMKEINSFLEWQIRGLADLISTGSTKALASDQVSYILPNGRAIADLSLLKQLKEVPYQRLPSFDLAVQKVNALVSLKAIDNMNQEDKDTLINMFKNDKSAMAIIKAEAMLGYTESYLQYPNTLFGFDNYRHTKSNPNQDYKIIEKNDIQEKDRLTYLGYEHKATLPTGELVMATSVSLTNNITNGLLGLTESSILGANVKNGRKLGFKGSVKDFKKGNVNHNLKVLWDNIKNNPNYYSYLTDTSNYQITLNHNGSIRDVIVDLPNNLRKEFIEETETAFEHIGNLQARQLEERAVNRDNQIALEVLNQKYKEDINKQKYIKIDGNYKAKDNSAESLRFEEAINNFYNSLPLTAKVQIENQGGLYVNRVELDNVIGYEQASITDIFTGKSGLPKPVQTIIKATMDAIIHEGGGKSPAKLLKQAETLKSELASVVKDIILNKSFVVPAQNLISNVIHLWTVGVPLNQIPSLIVKGYQEVKLHQQYERELLDINHRLQLGRLTNADKLKLSNRRNLLSSMLSKLSVAPLISAGIYTNIANKETDRQDSDFSMLGSISDKTGITKLKDGMNPIVKNALVLEGTKVHNLMNEFMNYGDFVAKYALYQHLTKNRGISSDIAMNVIRDEFINYSSNRGRAFDWANKVGLTWFLAYKLGIQRIIYRNMRRNTLRTLGTWAGADYIKNNDVFGSSLIQTVPQQRLWTDYSGYHFEMDNMIDGFESHWLYKLLM